VPRRPRLRGTESKLNDDAVESGMWFAAVVPLPADMSDGKDFVCLSGGLSIDVVDGRRPA